MPREELTNSKQDLPRCPMDGPARMLGFVLIYMILIAAAGLALMLFRLFS